jgi:hypothetical protein
MRCARAVEVGGDTLLIAANAESVLHTICRLHYDEADVFRDGGSAFTLRIGEGVFWTIYHRDKPDEEYETL